MSTGSRGEVFWRAPEQVRRPRRARPWLGLGLAVAVVAYVLIFGETGWLAVRAEEKAVAELRAELERTNADGAQVQARDEELRQPGSEELERVAREQYRMRREGEQVHHLVGGSEEAAAEAGQEDPHPRP